MLIDLVSAYGQDEMAAEFRLAELAEARHLERCRAWLASRLLRAAGAEPAAAPQKAA
jgi:hypothetical protein